MLTSLCASWEPCTFQLLASVYLQPHDPVYMLPKHSVAQRRLPCFSVSNSLARFKLRGRRPDQLRNMKDHLRSRHAAWPSLTSHSFATDDGFLNRLLTLCIFVRISASLFSQSHQPSTKQASSTPPPSTSIKQRLPRFEHYLTSQLVKLSISVITSVTVA